MPYWSYQPPGEGWLDALSPFSWMQIRPLGSYSLQQPDDTALPTVAPGDVATAEACFREPDGWLSCVTRDSIWAQQKRDRGLPEVPLDAPEFIPPSAPASPGPQPVVVVPSDTQTGVPEDETDVAVDWGTVFQGGVDLVNAWGQQPVTNFLQTPGGNTGIVPPMYTASSPAVSSCGCNSNPCVCGTVNGRPALVDPRTGKRCYKRRRRVMLTEGDFNTLLRIATLPNNSNVRTALAKAIGRR